MFNFFSKELLQKEKATFDNNEKDILNEIVSKVNENYVDNSSECKLSFTINSGYNVKALKLKILSLIEEEDRKDCFDVKIEKDPVTYKITIDWSFALYGLRTTDLNKNYVYVVRHLLDSMKEYASAGLSVFSKKFTWDEFFEGFTMEELDNLNTVDVEFALDKIKDCFNRLGIGCELFINEHDEISILVEW